MAAIIATMRPGPRVIPEPAIRGWRPVGEDNGVQIWQLDHAGQAAVMSQEAHPKHDPGWKVQIAGQPARHCSGNLRTITNGVKRDMEALAPVVVIQKPAVNVTEDLAANLPDSDYRMTDYEDRPW